MHVTNETSIDYYLLLSLINFGCYNGAKTSLESERKGGLRRENEEINRVGEGMVYKSK